MKLGLTTGEALERFQKFGPNEMGANSRTSILSFFQKVLFDPMGAMLLVLGGLYWVLGDHTDSLILFCAFFPVSAIDVLLEFRSNQALQALKSTISTFVKVYRNGAMAELLSREIVPEDVIVFEEGQSLCADGCILQCEALTVNESSLTGEALPVFKKAGDPFYSGTIVLAGNGIGQVEKTGALSRLGSIANLVAAEGETQSPLQRKVNFLVKRIFFAALGLAVGLFLLQWLRTGEAIGALITALTLGMAAVPEEFPLVFTLYLSLGAWRLSRKGVLVKSLPAVEALGGVDIICTDKTGTLTRGIFQLECLDPFRAKPAMFEHWQAAVLACELHPVDAMEVAILAEAKKILPNLALGTLAVDYPFENQGKHMSHAWKTAQGGYVAMKGAAEGVLEHCDLSPEERAEALLRLEHWAKAGSRVLGLAGRQKSITGNRAADESSLTFLGFLVFADPIRENVKDSIAKCELAGIEIKILTGDHLLTAHAVADAIELSHKENSLFTGAHLAAMSTQERARAFEKGTIFARLQPEQKHELIQVLQGAGHVVAMTGDGINDAPALRLADVGISMGKTATDVARSTAKIVLLKNDFLGLVEAVFEGRQIFANLRRSFSYLIAFHIPVVLLALLPALFGWTNLLLPVHIILLELLVHPVSAYTFENIRDQDLTKNRSLITRSAFLMAAFHGFLLTALAMTVFAFFAGKGAEHARGMALAVVVLGNISLVFVEVFPHLHRRFFSTSFAILAVVFALTRSAKIGRIFRIDVFSPEEFALCLAVSLLVILPALVLAFVRLRKGEKERKIQ